MDFIGIDKTVIKNFTVKNIDMAKLQSEGNISNVMCLRNCHNRYNYHAEQREDNFNIIKINDNNMFNSLKIDVKKVKNKFIQYAILDMSISLEGQNNLTPLSIGAYKQKVQAVFKYIYERYGINMDIRNIKFQSLELNATFELDEPFEEYVRALGILMRIAPATYKNRIIMSDHRKNKVNLMEVSNKSIKCKTYDKTEQLQQVYAFDTNKSILRIEYTLLTDAKIINVFGTNEINSLTDTQIKDFIKTQFNKDFISRYKDFKTDNQGKLYNIAKEFRATHKQWIKPYLTELSDYELNYKTPLLMDIEDLKEVVRKVDKINFNRNWKQVYKSCSTAFIGIDDKIEEIFIKIQDIK